MHINRLNIIQPCSRPLRANSDGRLLRCEYCPHPVINLEACSSEEANELLKQNGTGRLCVRIRRNEFGEVLLKEGSVRSCQSRVNRLFHRVALSLLACGALSALPKNLLAQSLYAEYGDTRVSDSVTVIFNLLDGSVGALSMLISFALAIAGFIALGFIKRKRLLLLAVTLVFLTLGFTLFGLRSFSATFFNDVNMSSM